MKRVVSITFQIVKQLLNARLVADRRISVRLCRPRLGRVLTAKSVYMIELFGSLIIRLEGIVFNGPSRRNSIGVLDFVEVTLAQTKEDAAIDLAITTDKIVKSGTKFFSLRVVPGFHCLIPRVRKDGLAVPIFSFPRQIIAALQKEDSLSRLCQPPSHGASAWPRANNDHVIMFAAHHGVLLSDLFKTSLIAQHA